MKRSESNKPSDSLSAYERYQELNTDQVMKLVGIESRRTVWRYVEAGKLPKPRYLSSRRPLWRLGELLDHTHRLMKTPDEITTGFPGMTRPPAQQEDDNENLLQKMRQRLKLG
jgi:predicted DNA-binding transcriptional regulator AlpA